MKGLEMKKPSSLEEVMASLPKEQQEKIRVRGEELFAQIKKRMTLAELRKERKVSQSRIAEILGVDQVQVSRLERRTDPKFSTLKRTIASMGGHLTMIATFPDREPVVLLPVKVAAKSHGTLRKKSS